MNGIAIDSGVNPACAWFESREVIAASFTQYPVLPWSGCDWVLVEQWQFRGAVDVPRVPKLIKMMTGGLIAAGYAAGQAGCEVTLVTPDQWKGTEPKPSMHQRAWHVLSSAEREVLGGDKTRLEIWAAVERGALKRWAISGAECYGSRSTAHNLLDAACMGLVHLGRLERR